jgi:hypothetical protein
MGRWGNIGLAALASTAALAVAAFGATSAQAALTHDFNFAGSGTAGGQLSNPAGIAINQTTGDVYVAEVGNSRISEFTAGGAFIRTWGFDVVAPGKPNDKGEAFEVCDTTAGNVPSDCQAGKPSFVPGAFDQPVGIAVDNSGGPDDGTVYVQDKFNLRVQRFTSEGQFVLMWGKHVNSTSGGDICPRPGNPGDICQKGAGTSDLTGFNSEVLSLGGWESLGAYGGQLAVDEDGHVYTSSGRESESRVVQFDSTGHVLGLIHEKPGSEPEAFTLPYALTTDGAGHIYVSEASIFGPRFQKFPTADFSPSGITSGSDVSFPYYGEDPAAFAVDPGNQYLFVADSLFLSPCQTVVGNGQDHVVEYSPGGELADCSPPTTAGMEFLNGAIHGLAVSPTHKLYMVVNSQIRVFDTPVASAPAVDSESATGITTNSALLKARVSANLSSTTYHVEYGTSPCSELPDPCTSLADTAAGSSLLPKGQSAQLKELDPDTTYYYRFVVTNGAGSAAGLDEKFHTFPAEAFDASCPNNLARQQTDASFLLDCRAYELVSAENQGGYDVESNLVPGQMPFPGFPEASDKALYAVHSGGIPGSGHPTNRGPDPYVATRDAKNQRWDTEYVGVPAGAPSAKPFSSTVAGADSSLGSFAFGGPEICDPCFRDGSAGMPLRKPDGSLSQGMVGSIPVAEPEPAGEVKKHLSADGHHFVFGSEQQFEAAGNPENGNVTIYDRDLIAGTTQVASTNPSGVALADGSKVAELDISNDGSRILIGDLVGEEEGVAYWHLYMHVGSNPQSIDLTPGVSEGVIYDGMTSDGTIVYFTTRDPLTTTEDQDTDTSADLFRSVVGSSSATLSRVSTGTSGTGNTDFCDPAANSYNPKDWNVIPGGPTDCSVVAIGGRGGIATGSGAIYFLSPEKLDGSGVEGAPNLFLAAPGSAPRFVATLESSANVPLKPASPLFDHFVGPFSRPVGAAIDRQDGSVYVYDTDESFLSPQASVQKFDSSGNPDNSFGTASKLTGLTAIGDASELGLPVGLPDGIAVDNNSSSPNYGDLFVLDIAGFQGTIKRFNSSGVLQQTIPVGGLFEFPTSIAISPTTDHIYVPSVPLFGGDSTINVFDASGAPVAPTSFSVSGAALGVGVDSNGKLYVANGSNTKIYDATTGAPLGTLDAKPSVGVSVDPGEFSDPSDDVIYVDEGNQVTAFDSSGSQIGEPLASGIVSGSVSLGADAGTLAVSNYNGGNAAVFLSKIPSDRGYDNPLVIESVRAKDSPRSDLFQTNRSGKDAVFSTTLPLTGFDSGGKYELIRYDAATEHFDCTSCSPTGLPPSSDAKLASNGLSVTDDGRVFFDTREPLTLRDTNNQLDAYEWESEQPQDQVGACHSPGGCIQLISSGKGRSDSGLLTVSDDGTNAFFFTRDTLANNDENGNQMKLYTARENGGFFVIPPQPPCVASDECHGAGSKAAPPATIGTLSGATGNAGGNTRCDADALARKAQQLSRRADLLEQKADRAPSARQGQRLRKMASKDIRIASRDARAARRCRRQTRRGK